MEQKIKSISASTLDSDTKLSSTKSKKENQTSHLSSISLYPQIPSLLDSLRKRKTKQEKSIHPQDVNRITQWIIRNFLTPQNRIQIITPRTETSNPPNKHQNRLVFLLQKNLDSIKSKKSLLEDRFKVVSKQKMRIKREVFSLKKKLSDSLSCLKILKDEVAFMEKTATIEKKSFNFYEINFKEQSEQAEKIKSRLSWEKEKNFEMKTKEASLLHLNSELQSTNTIIGERLKGLFYSTESLSEKKKKHQKIHEEQKLNLVELIKKYESQVPTLSIFLHLNHLVLNESELNSQQRIHLYDEIHKIHFNFRQKADYLKRSISISLWETKKNKRASKSIEKKYNYLSESFYKLKATVKEYSKRMGRTKYIEETICKFCNQIFIEAENEDCLFHPSEWNGKMFWCCGGKKKAPGCKKGKHEAIYNKKEKKKLEISKFCSSCKKKGHLCWECPYDPNAFSSSGKLQNEGVFSFEEEKRKKDFVESGIMEVIMESREEDSEGSGFEKERANYSAFTCYRLRREQSKSRRQLVAKINELKRNSAKLQGLPTYKYG